LEGALSANTTGIENTAVGQSTLLSNTTGGVNTAVGFNALRNSTTGNNNIGFGDGSGANLTTSSNNIEIGNVGVAAESNTIRIGTQGVQGKAFIAGIFNTLVSGDAVVVASTGQLGIVKSSARYKRDIRDMGHASDALMKLRPVTFRYKEDPRGELQYGLIAEEVARRYPELVGRGSDGRPESVHYLSLISMLLNEVQKQARENAKQAEQLKQVSAQMLEVNAKLLSLEAMQRKTGEGKLAAAQ
jgi:hypothetical protein